jgi:hypothetical protein
MCLLHGRPLAKLILLAVDLCQNPLTVRGLAPDDLHLSAYANHLPWLQQKEPKLNRARAIPEWDSYDQEIASFALRVSERNKELISVAKGMGQGVDEMAGLASMPQPEIEWHTSGGGDLDEAGRIVDEL